PGLVLNIRCMRHAGAVASAVPRGTGLQRVGAASHGGGHARLLRLDDASRSRAAVKAIFVVDRAQEWPFELAGASVVTARTYLTDTATGAGGDEQVINLCRADRYQGRGYY